MKSQLVSNSEVDPWKLMVSHQISEVDPWKLMVSHQISENVVTEIHLLLLFVCLLLILPLHLLGMKIEVKS